MKESLGGLLAAGWTLDDVLALSWEQTMFVAECVMLHKVALLNMVAEPVMAAMGTKYKRGRVSANKRRAGKRASEPGGDGGRESSEARLLLSIQQAGFGVESG